jgi:hypothetical protein
MAQAYLWQQRFAPPVQTASVRFPKKIQFNPKCPAVNRCVLGAVTNVSIDSNAVVTLSSSYLMQGLDNFKFTVSNVICNGTYMFHAMSSSNYPTGALKFGQLCTVQVSPIIDGHACSTFNVMCTSIVPNAPYGVKSTTSNVTWYAPITPENYGIATITSYTISSALGTNTIRVTSPSLVITGNRVTANVTVSGRSQVFATNMAGSSPYSRQG